MSQDLSNHYRVVLDDLQRQRDALAQELRQVEGLIEGISRQLPSIAGFSSAKGERTTNLGQPPRRFNYGRMSVRWGVLAYLGDEAPGRMKTPQIASALLAGGYQSEGANFANIVSGVLSTLKSRGEVDASDEGYQLTTSGMAAWQHIRSSQKFVEQQHGTMLDNA